MIKTKKSSFLLALMTLVMTLAALFGVLVWRNEKSTVTASAADNISVTEVQFRTSGGSCYFFLRMSGQTDYTQANQWHSGILLKGNVLDKVTVYFLDGAYSLRDVWNGVNFGTYIWGDDHTLVFPMKSQFLAQKGNGARIDAGTEIMMVSGALKTTSESRTFWYQSVYRWL